MTNEEFIEKISLEGEEWKDIAGFEGLYKVSSLGRVISLSKYINNRYKDIYKKPKLLKPHINGSSTSSVLLYKDGTSKKIHIPILVASTFIPKPQNAKYVRLIDGNNRNCHVSNIEWIIPKNRRKHYDTSSIDGEVWKDIPGYEGLYMISSMGRIKSAYSKRILSLVPSGHKGKDYYVIALVRNGEKKNFPIHRLVAMAFIPNPLNLPCVDHLNTDRFDNRVENLRWCTYSENNLNPITSSKKHKPVVQIKDGTVIHIYESIRAATEHGFSLSCIIACCRGKNVSHRGFRWMYLSDYETLVNKSKNSIPDTVYPQ